MTTNVDLVLELGPVSVEPEADVTGVVRGAENGNGLGEQLRSLAHPNWPYAGTPWAWRGFVGINVIASIKDMPQVFPGGLTVVDTEVRYHRLKFGQLD